MAEADHFAGAAARRHAAATDAGELTRDGDTWAWTWAGTTVRVKHAKGIADLALLLERAGREVHVRELEGAAAPSTAATGQAVLDEAAVQQYRQRLVDLEDDLDEAERHGDAGRAERLTVERDALVEELTKAFGLGGRARTVAAIPTSASARPSRPG